MERPLLPLVVCAALAIPTLVAGAYVGGYFVLMTSSLTERQRIFRSEWQMELYEPMVRLEAWASGRDLYPGYEWDFSS